MSLFALLVYKPKGNSDDWNTEKHADGEAAELNCPIIWIRRFRAPIGLGDLHS